jgi:taurine dioxygenase
MLECAALSPVGVRVTGLHVDALDDQTVVVMCRLLAEHGVVILAGQDVGDDEFARFLRSFGPTMFTVGETPVAGFPELNLISNVGLKRRPRSTFHTDTSYVRKPPAYTALRAVQVPERGGATLFTNQYVAYATLPDRVRAQLDGRTITHVVSGLELGEGEESSAAHPVFRVHPVSGRTCLYLSTPQRCVAVSGLAPALVGQTVKYLFDHSTRATNVYRHAWSPDDVVMWDNRCVMHRADHSGVVGARVMHRGMVADQTR